MFSLVPTGQGIVRKPKEYLPCLWYWGGLGQGTGKGIEEKTTIGWYVHKLEIRAKGIVIIFTKYRGLPPRFSHLDNN